MIKQALLKNSILVNYLNQVKNCLLLSHTDIITQTHVDLEFEDGHRDYWETQHTDESK